MKAMILAAGQGTRLRPHTDAMPKPLIPVAGRSFLERTLDRLSAAGVTDVVVNVCYRPARIVDALGDGGRWGLRIHYSVEPTLRGTAGALRPWRTFFDADVLVCYGDNYCACDLPALLRQHRARRADVTVVLHWREDVSSSGVASLDEDDRIARFVEKPAAADADSHWVNAGLLVLARERLDDIPDVYPSDLSRDLLPRWIADGRAVFGHRLSAAERVWWIDTPDDLARASRALASERAADA